MRVLVVTNLVPDESTPQRGRWVHDQIAEVRRLGVDVDVFTFPLGKGEYVPAVRRLRRHLRSAEYDLVHAHYGLAGICAWAAGAKPLVVTFHGTDVRHRSVGAMSRVLARRIDLAAGVSRSLFREEGGRPGLPMLPGATAVLPCGPDLGRFRPRPSADARRDLGLDPDGRYLLFPTDPSRAEKRYELAVSLANECNAELLTGGGIDPERMPDWVNAAGAVLVTSVYEGFGLACLEALACGRPVLSTPVGIAPYALRGVPGTLCAPFEIGEWSRFAGEVLDDPPPPVDAAARVEALSAPAMAERVVAAYRELMGVDAEVAPKWS